MVVGSGGAFEHGCIAERSNGVGNGGRIRRGGKVVHPGFFGRQIDRRVDDSRRGAQALFDPGDAGSARHAFDRHGQCRRGGGERRGWRHLRDG